MKAPWQARPGHVRLAAVAALVALLMGVMLVAGWHLACRLWPYPAQALQAANTSSLTIVDGRGQLLWQAARPQGGRETWTRVDQISVHMRNATLAAEDHRFLKHNGIDGWGVLRAAWLNLSHARVGFGGSTLTMQLARLLRPELARRSVGAKLQQAFDATRIEQRLSKSLVLEQYLNRAYYGHGAWGATAAARHYFDKNAADLSPAEAAVLAVLPRGPRLYDPDRNWDGLLARQRYVLGRMRALGLLESRSHELAVAMPIRLAQRRPAYRAPHFVDMVRARLPADLAPGARVETTLDLQLQQRLEVAVKRHLDGIGGRHLTQAGVVVMRNHDGAILGLVGSADYFGDQAGAVNVITSLRRPGSTLKPFVYALALERGDSPSTVALDVVLPDEVLQPYTADVKQHGFARYREALAGSYNLAAVHTLKRVGIPVLLARLREAGVRSLSDPDEAYGLGLAIGEAQFTVLEYAGAFSAFGAGGVASLPRAIARITAPHGHMRLGEPVVRRRVFSDDVAYLVFDMLSDGDARRPMFAQQAPMELPFDVALKTGTTRAYTDTLAFGTTAQFTVGVWGGNFDGSPTQTVMAMQGAAPLVRAAFVAVAALYGEPSAPPRPSNLVRAPVCALSGQHAGPHCPGRKWDWFVAGTQPGSADACRMHVHRCGKSFTSFPPELQGWARSFGVLQPDPCAAPPTQAPRIVYPAEGAVFRLDAHRPLAQQLPPLRSVPDDAHVIWQIDGQPLAAFDPTPGLHTISARSAAGSDAVHVRFEGGAP